MHEVHKVNQRKIATIVIVYDPNEFFRKQDK